MYGINRLQQLKLSKFFFTNQSIRNVVTETYGARNIIRKVRRIQIIPEEPAPPPTSQAPEPTNAVEEVGGVLGDRKVDRKNMPAVVESYRAIQKDYPGYVVLYQVGDFFEVFDETATKISQALDIGLCESRYGTKMTGFPLRTMDGYIERIMKAGLSVVLVEQYEAGKSIGRRVTRVITPGTLTEENLLQSGTNNFMLSIASDTNGFGLAWIDLSTGYFKLVEVGKEELYNELVRIDPIEIIADEKIRVNEGLERFTMTNKAVFAGFQVDSPTNSSIFKQVFGEQFVIDDFTDLEVAAGAKLLQYVLKTQLEKRPYIETPSRHGRESDMQLDASALRALEILKNNSTNSRENSLLHVLDLTCTAAGSRLLIQRLQTPLTDIEKINHRLDQVSFFFERQSLVEELCELFKKCKDLERCFQRLALNRSSGGPRDMQVIQQTLDISKKIKETLSKVKNDETANSLRDQIHDLQWLVKDLKDALVDSPPARASDGELIRPGYSKVLDSLRGDTASIESKSGDLLEKYKRETNRKGLKLCYKKTLGWLLEVSKSEGELDEAHFIYDSQVDKKFRYRTTELEALNRAFVTNEDEYIREECRIYETLRQKIVSEGKKIMQIAKVIAEIDLVTSLALLAKKRNYTRPIVTMESEFLVENGRHPVVEYKHADVGRTFIHNSCDLGEASRFAFITGPNMGGKSTFLRQNAIIAIMAQCGMYVPADRAKVGIIDAIFTRIGASDDLSRDRSTFMVEMMETANILKRVTCRSLVIMDEIGRGTASREGFGLAWGICKYLYSKSCRTLFATHYSDLALLIKTFESSQCLMTVARLENGELYFLHQIFPGVATCSHAVEIARLAGIPEEVLDTSPPFTKGSGSELESESRSGSNLIELIRTEVDNTKNFRTLKGYQGVINRIREIINGPIIPTS